jgi:hypothetical protein
MMAKPGTSPAASGKLSEQYVFSSEKQPEESWFVRTTFEHAGRFRLREPYHGFRKGTTFANDSEKIPLF